MFNFKSKQTDEQRILNCREDVEVKLQAFLVASEALNQAISKSNMVLAEIAGTYYEEKELIDQSISNVENELDINNRLKYYLSELNYYRW